MGSTSGHFASAAHTRTRAQIGPSRADRTARSRRESVPYSFPECLNCNRPRGASNSHIFFENLIQVFMPNWKIGMFFGEESAREIGERINPAGLFRFPLLRRGMDGSFGCRVSLAATQRSFSWFSDVDGYC